MTDELDFHFDFQEFNSIFPFFIELDDELLICRMGESITALFPEATGRKFSEAFIIERPVTEKMTKKELSSLIGKLIILKTLNDSQIRFRGQFNLLKKNNTLLFIGAPWFNNLKEFSDSGLLLKDFAPHNPTIDLLHILKTQEIVNEDLKEMVNQSRKQRELMAEAQNKLTKTTEELEESNKRYEFVNKATRDAIWDWDILTGRMYNGEGFSRLFGYDTNDAEENYNVWEKRIHPDDQDRINQTIQEILQSTETNWEEEYRYLKSDGTYAFVEDKGFIVRNNTGHPVRMIGAMKDVTEKKKEKEYLKLMESVIRNTNDSVVITEINNDYPIVFVNEAFTRLTGYSFEEVKGKNPRILQGPNTDKKILAGISASLASWQNCEATILNYKKNGEAFWVNFSLNPIANEKGEYTHWISVERDVTASININEDLKVQKKFTEDILNNLPTDIAVFDPMHNYVFINSHAIKDDATREWLLNKNDFDYARMKGIDDSMAKLRWKKFEEAVDNNKPSEWVDEHTDKLGNPVYKLRIFAPVFEKKKLKYVIGYGADITENKKAELKIKEVLETVKKSNLELEQFAYVASHDLQEPLRMVTNILSQLEKKYKDQLDDKAKEYIYYAVDGARRMRQIILDLLDYSRVDKIDFNQTSVDTNELVSEICILFSRQMEESQATVIRENLPVITGSKAPLRQLFQNIISNALKYHRKGVATVVTVSCKEESDCWVFSVSDNGIGIEKQYFGKIFEIFQRLHSRDEYSGTGIGLAITKKIVERMGGNIWIESEPGKGTCFHFTVPFVQKKLS